MKRVVSLMIAAVAVFALSGCGGGTDGGGAVCSANDRYTGDSELSIDHVSNSSIMRGKQSSLKLEVSNLSVSYVSTARSTPTMSTRWTNLPGTPITYGDSHIWGSDKCDQLWDLEVTDDLGDTYSRTYCRECGTTTYFMFQSN